MSYNFYADKGLSKIALEDLVAGRVYRISSRNLSVGVWLPAALAKKDTMHSLSESGGFIGVREKFGDEYLFTEFFADGKSRFGTATPYADLGEIPEGVTLSEEDDKLFEFLKPLSDAAQSEYIEWFKTS